MRNIKPVEAEISASFELTIIQNIPASQLEAMEKTYSFMLSAVRSALQARRDADAKADAVHLHVVESKADYNRQCLMLRRARRRGVSFRSLARIAREHLQHP